MSTQIHHQSIMVEEILEHLALSPDGVYVDATCGEGGHSYEIASRIPNGRLLCIDRNEIIMEVAKSRLAEFSNITFINARFDQIEEVLARNGIEQVDGILADLGISMFHLREKGLGFSYDDEESLDMRLDSGQKFSAEMVVNTFKEKEIADIIYKYGEERESRRIARAIMSARPIRSAKHLAEIVMRGKHYKKGRIHPATLTFQALRIFVNDELAVIERFIPIAVERLKKGGHLAIMSFHSMEDRIVKNAFRALKIDGQGQVVTKKPICASEQEIKRNPSSRSAKLRIFEKDFRDLQ